MSKVTRIIPSLPRINAPIGHIPQRLKIPGIPTGRARLEVLRGMVTKLVREERCEFKYNRAEEVRPYMERLIQLAILRGRDDEYTMEMMNWWLIQRDLISKMFEILVPRFSEMPDDQPYTNIYRLPNKRLPRLSPNMSKKYNTYEIAVLELKGNPFPSIETLEQERLAHLRDFVLKGVIGEDVYETDLNQNTHRINRHE